MTIRRSVEEYRTENVGIETGPQRGTPKQSVHVVELDAELQVLLDDVLDRERRRDDDAAGLRVFGQQRRSIALDLLLGR